MKTLKKNQPARRIMAMLRQFDELPTRALKKLISAHLEFIGIATPFYETRKIISDIQNKLSAENKKTTLQPLLINIMNIVKYWDDHQGRNGLFRPAQKSIVNNMLTDSYNILTNMPPLKDTHTHYKKL